MAWISGSRLYTQIAWNDSCRRHIFVCSVSLRFSDIQKSVELWFARSTDWGLRIAQYCWTSNTKPTPIWIYYPQMGDAYNHIPRTSTVANAHDNTWSLRSFNPSRTKRIVNAFSVCSDSYFPPHTGKPHGFPMFALLGRLPTCWIYHLWHGVGSLAIGLLWTRSRCQINTKLQESRTNIEIFLRFMQEKWWFFSKYPKNCGLWV